jgi:hypothetical protein
VVPLRFDAFEEEVQKLEEGVEDDRVLIPVFFDDP